MYLAPALSLYAKINDLYHLFVLGHAAPGMGGELIVPKYLQVLKEEHSVLASEIKVTIPNEQFRRVGQSMAAVSLSEV